MSPLIITVIKGGMSLTGIGILAFAIEGFFDAKFILELIMIFVGIACTAVLVKSRVTSLEKDMMKVATWQKEHDGEVIDYKESHSELHRKMSEQLAVLRQIMEDQQRRITDLEAARWREVQRG